MSASKDQQREWIFYLGWMVAIAVLRAIFLLARGWAAWLLFIVEFSFVE